jgi:hypothetical protein
MTGAGQRRLIGAGTAIGESGNIYPHFFCVGEFRKEMAKVPRMSKKRKQEWTLFLNHRNRITYNELCRKCRFDCKQSFRVLVIECPKFMRKERKPNGKSHHHKSQ